MFLLFFLVSIYISFAFYVWYYLPLIDSSIFDVEDELLSEMCEKHIRTHTDSMAHRKQNLTVPISFSFSLSLSLSLSLTFFSLPVSIHFSIYLILPYLSIYLSLSVCPLQYPLLKVGDMVKIDLGAHMDGYIVVAAHTVIVRAIPAAGTKYLFYRFYCFFDFLFLFILW